MLTNEIHTTSTAQLDAVFSALGDPTRRDIVARLAVGEAPLSRLAMPYDMSLTAVSRHVQVLSDAGIVAIEKRGRTRHCRLRASGLSDAAEWMDVYRAFWTRQFGALAAHLESDGDSK